MAMDGSVFIQLGQRADAAREFLDTGEEVRGGPLPGDDFLEVGPMDAEAGGGGPEAPTLFPEVLFILSWFCGFWSWHTERFLSSLPLACSGLRQEIWR